MHDKHGVELQRGDHVTVECEVVLVAPGDVVVRVVGDFGGSPVLLPAELCVKVPARPTAAERASASARWNS